MLNANITSLELITKTFDHKSNAESFAAKHSPKKANLQEFVEDPNGDYCYTYAYENEIVSHILKKLRVNAKRIGLSVDIFSRVKEKDVQYIKISKSNYEKWLSSNSANYGCAMIVHKRTFESDTIRNIVFTKVSGKEAPFKIASSIRRHLLPKYHNDVVINDQATPPRVEMSKEAYEALISKEKTLLNSYDSKEKPKRLIPVCEREFIRDEKSNCYYALPYKGEDIAVIQGVFKERAKAINLDPAIFELDSFNSQQACKITAENYEKWQARVKVKAKTKKIYVVRRAIQSDNDAFYFQVFDGEYSGKVFSSLTRYCKVHKLDHLVKELRNDVHANRVYITQTGKSEWDKHLATLNGLTYRYTQQHLKSSAKSAPTAKFRTIDDSHTFIATKYLKDTVSLPFATKNTLVESKVTDSIDLLFNPLKSILLSQSAPLKERKLILENDRKYFHIRVVFRKGKFTLNLPYQQHFFIRGGRQLAARIPAFSAEQNQCTIYLMMSNSEFQEANKEDNEFYNRLPENIQLIIIDKVLHDKNGLPANEVRTSNVKRIVSLLLADHYKIPDYVLLDDNICKFSVSAAILDEMTPNHIFNLFRSVANQTIYSNKQKPLCITTGKNAPYKNIPHRLDATALQPLKPCLGSKLMYIDSKVIIEKANISKIPLASLCSFKHLWWGEDYYFQLALMIMTKDNVSVLGQLSFSIAYFEKDKKYQNVTLDIPNFQKANTWLEELDKLSHNSDLTFLQSQVAIEMSRIVKAELKRREEQQQKCSLSKTVIKPLHDHALSSIYVDVSTSDKQKLQPVITVSTEKVVPVAKVTPTVLAIKSIPRGPKPVIKNPQNENAESTLMVATKSPDTTLSTELSASLCSAEVQPETAIESPIITQKTLFSFKMEKARITGAECGNHIAMLGFPLNDNKLRQQAIKQFGEDKNLIHYYIESAKCSHAAIFKSLSAAEIKKRQNAFHHKPSIVKL